MAKPEYSTANRIESKNPHQFNQTWLQDRIAEKPPIMSLGDLDLLDRERRQEKAERLDLLLSGLEKNARFEDAGINAFDENKFLRLTLKPAELKKNMDLISQVLYSAVGLFHDQ